MALDLLLCEGQVEVLRQYQSLLAFCCPHCDHLGQAYLPSLTRKIGVIEEGSRGQDSQEVQKWEGHSSIYAQSRLPVPVVSQPPFEAGSVEAVTTAGCVGRAGPTPIAVCRVKRRNRLRGHNQCIPALQPLAFRLHNRIPSIGSVPRNGQPPARSGNRWSDWPQSLHLASQPLAQRVALGHPVPVGRRFA
ncbi:hypothetical protein B0T26DRAFT_672603 [Lasiosphaeria miniovina]|uniref:Uncharacterized protein n=1 Tax=Lasiosphaeria miniovina TaxID=1954250 RepID=A0AA40B5I9_9PEZI|nr:uncharacterized protein B0T26DRAFT_672603 [Lasiosphaeria miniovina]KAK0728008.1 hypothetical protein B0T26DRAFT_672603 [Lasiosphaeria miniovina]